MAEPVDALALPDLAAIRAAHARILPHVHRTPVLRSDALDAAAGGQLFFKCENLQQVGAFKARGAANAVFGLADDVAARGVVTHSSGNHGAALAYAGQRRGIPAYIVMPENAPKIKVANVRSFGGDVRFCAPTVAAREAACAELARSTGATLVHPFDNMAVIAGQGTAALELLDEVADLDIVIAPCGGGGLLSGTAIASKGVRPGVKVFGAEPHNAGDAAQASGRAGSSRCHRPRPSPTVCAPRSRRARSRPSRRASTHSAPAPKTGIVAAMRMTWEHLRIVIEPSSAVPLACLLEGTLEVSDRRAGIILTGGNVDLDRLPWQKGS